MVPSETDPALILLVEFNLVNTSAPESTQRTASGKAFPRGTDWERRPSLSRTGLELKRPRGQTGSFWKPSFASCWWMCLFCFDCHCCQSLLTSANIFTGFPMGRATTSSPGTFQAFDGYDCWGIQASILYRFQSLSLSSMQAVIDEQLYKPVYKFPLWYIYSIGSPPLENPNTLPWSALGNIYFLHLFKVCGFDSPPPFWFLPFSLYCS